MSFSINKLRSHLLFTYKNLCFMILCGEKVLLQEIVGRVWGGGKERGLHFKKLGNIHSPRPAFQNPNVESTDELGKPRS